MATPSSIQPAPKPNWLKRIHVTAHQGYVQNGCGPCQAILDAAPGTIGAALRDQMNKEEQS